MFLRLQCTGGLCSKELMLSAARYTSAKSRLLSNKVMELSDGVPAHIIASLVAGTVATTVCAPADVLKSRLQSAATKGRHSPVRSDFEISIGIH
jgi:hypothetical protein